MPVEDFGPRGKRPRLTEQAPRSRIPTRPRTHRPLADARSQQVPRGVQSHLGMRTFPSPTHHTVISLFWLLDPCLIAAPVVPIVRWTRLTRQFGGHGLIPNLIRDMRRPQDADRVVELTYAVSMVVYLVIAVCGYLMYGRNVSDEVSLIATRTLQVHWMIREWTLSPHLRVSGCTSDELG